jgi:hypothetical protein
VFSEEQATRDPAAKLCLQFVTRVKELYSAMPDEAYRTANEIKKLFIENPV